MFELEAEGKRVIQIDRARKIEREKHRDFSIKHGGYRTNGGLGFEPTDFIPSEEELELIEKLSNPDEVTSMEAVAGVSQSVPKDRVFGVFDMIFENRRNILGKERG